jgi:ligand-binding sensor domain-containing protein/serine phosphatase RsbU (regulator of sigma subunit)
MAVGQSSAQTYDFQNFTVENGLSQSQVVSLYQDEEGELWMGTNSGGINRYNGTNFSYLTKDDGLSDNVVFAMATAPDGDVLAGTYNGLSIIRGKQITVVDTTRGLPHQGVLSILTAKDGTVWLGTGKGVCKLVGDSAMTVPIHSKLDSSTVYSIREGSGGIIWFCTLGKGLFRWDGKTARQITTANGLLDNYVYDVLPMGRKNAWVFGHNGLYSLKDTVVLQIPVEIAGSATFYSYQRDKAGSIWIGTSRGVLKYNNSRFTLLDQSNGLVDNVIWKVMQDREGNLWFASKTTGVSKLNSERFKLYDADSLPDKEISAILKDSQGRMWLGTDRGVVVWKDMKAQHVFRYKDGLSTEIIRDIKEDAKGNIHIATKYGLTIWDGKKLIPIYAKSNSMNDCYALLIDGEDVWVGTIAGVARIEDGRMVAAGDSTQFRNYVFDICKRKDGLWFAYENGLLHYDGTTFKNLTAKNGFTDGRTRSVINGPDGNLWFGNNDGVFRWNGKKLQKYDESYGLMANGVYSLIFDPKGDLWVGQSKGLCKMTFAADTLQSVLRYSREQGFLGLDCNANSIMVDEDSVLWVGTSNGLVSFDPRLDKGEYYRPLTRITGIKLFSQPVNWQLFTDSVNDAGLPYRMELDYDKNHLTFVFTGVSLTTPRSINYTYMLEGFDEDWSPVANSNEATYANLPPGTYTFKVRSGYGNEIWQNETVEYRFTIRPPFYRTTWFYILVGLVLAGIAYSYYTIRRANVQITRQKGEIEEQKDVIEKKKDEIEKKNREMTDSINYASTIQSAILPSDDLWRKLLPDSFVLYQPKDIVSGDFYWLENRGAEVFFAAVDCTGHGVPGALMSIIGNNGLNQAVNEHRLMDPAVILNYLSMSVNESLRKSEKSNYVKDGMDIALCRINLKTRVLHYAGAYNPLVVVRNGEAIITKADRIAIGSMDNVGRTFTNHEMQLEPGDCVYIYSDGYADQFGGADGKKLKTAPMMKKLVELSPLPMAEQVRALRAFFMEWKGPLEQVDDICVIGLRV